MQVVYVLLQLPDVEQLEISQLEERNDSAETHRILKMVDRVSSDLPRAFDAIRAKIRR